MGTRSMMLPTIKDATDRLRFLNKRRRLADQLFDQLIDLLATDISRYLSQPRAIIDNYMSYNSISLASY